MRPGSVIRRLAVAALLATAWAWSAQAQDVQRIAAVVNEEAVSMFDLVQRLKLVVFSSGLEQSPQVMERLAPQVLRTLIDERLRLQEAERRNVSVSDAELSRAIAEIEQRNRLPEGSFDAYLESNDIDPRTAITQIKAEIAWAKLIGRRLQETVTITEEDIDDEIERLRSSQGKPEFRYAEIFLIVETTGQERDVRENAHRLVEQLRAGADFGVIARQFSDAATASQGGDVGWVAEDQIADEVADALAELRPNEVSDPINTAGGYLIVQLLDRREMTLGNPDDVQVALRRVVLTVPEDAEREEIETHIDLAETIRETVVDCEDMARVARQADPSIASEVGTVRIKNLAPSLRPTVRTLPVGEVSEPLITPMGVALFMVCDRIEPETALPDRDEIEQKLLEDNLDRVSRRYLRELRRAAFVEIRI